MLDWTLISVITVAAMIFNELVIARAKTLGLMVCFQPLWSHRLLLAALAAGVALNIATARFALEGPSVHRTWYLLFSAAPPLIALFVYGFTEITHANRALNAAVPGRSSVVSFLQGWRGRLLGGLGGLVATIALGILPKYAFAYPRPQEILQVEAGIVETILLLALVFFLEIRHARRELAATRRKT